jgi:hypothetical protein
LTGQVFDRLTVLGQTGSGPQGCLWRVRCQCGQEFSVRSNSLRTGGTRSCGCRRRKHGESRRETLTREYAAWQSMVSRCEYPQDRVFRHYGGRGIRVCERWRSSYPTFLADMGRRPSPTHSLDRIDPNGNYEASNCRWATPKEQARNKRTSRVLNVGGESRTVAEWAERTGIGFTTIRERIRRGWDPERAVSTPVRSTAATRASSSRASST